MNTTLIVIFTIGRSVFSTNVIILRNKWVMEFLYFTYTKILLYKIYTNRVYIITSELGGGITPDLRHNILKDQRNVFTDKATRK